MKLAGLFGHQTGPAPRPYTIHYERLSPNWIRLLKLHPGGSEDDIVCDLIAVSLDNIPKYTALSWAWGPPSTNYATFTINGRPHSVQPNLHEAMRAVRDTSVTTRIWIDAICINRSEVEEKVVQIPLMASIYSLANEVLIWLGPHDKYSEYLMDCLHQGQTTEWKSIRFFLALTHLAHRAWTERTWVAQEFALSKLAPRIKCGSSPSISSDIVHEATQYANVHIAATRESWFRRYTLDVGPQSDDEIRAGIQESDGVRYTLEIADLHNQPPRSPWEDFSMTRLYKNTGYLSPCLILMFGKGLKSTDPRDKLYGVLGLLLRRHRDYFLSRYKIDYSRPTETVFRDAIEFVLAVNAEHISAVFANLEPCAGSPSWVRDLTVGSTRMIILPQSRQWDGRRGHHRFADSQTLVLSGYRGVDRLQEVLHFPLHKTDPISPVARFVQNWLTLSLWGIYIWYICHCLVYLPLEKPFMDKIRHAVKCVQGMEHLRQTLLALAAVKRALLSRYAEESQLPEALWETLMMEHVDLTPSLHAQFQTLMSLDEDALSTPWKHVAAATTYLRVEGMGGVVEAIDRVRGLSFFICADGWYGITRRNVRKGDELVLLGETTLTAFFVRGRKRGKVELVSVASVPDALRDRYVERDGEGMEELFIF